MNHRGGMVRSCLLENASVACAPIPLGTACEAIRIGAVGEEWATMMANAPADRWQTIQILKTDLFSRIELGRYGNDTLIIRRVVGAAPWQTRWFGHMLAAREAKVLQRLQGMEGMPQLLKWQDGVLERTYLPGVSLVAGRVTDPGYYRKAHLLLRRLHRRGVVHNDLAKEANWIVTEQGNPAIIDFQIACLFHRRGFAFKAMAREDLRHLLKHKRRFCPDHLTPKERQVVSSKSPFSHAWMVLYQKPYKFITRRLFNWRDSEGLG